MNLRDALDTDLPFLISMWFEAAFWDPATRRPTIEQALAVPELAIYIDGWGRTGDGAVIATDDEPVGAAWYRLFAAEKPGYGFVDERTPELGIGVVAHRRREGIGAALLDALCERATSDGFEQISLAVSGGNNAIHLYERAGFVVVSPEGTGWKMVKALRGSSGDA
ncbi:MAG: GNAT family N-acetyltransferase [Actinomycetota bacterium]